MKPEPPRTLQTIARYLLPQGAREHVLGDLQEQYSETSSPARYLLNVLSILPYVIRGQAARNLDGRLVAVEAAALAASLALATLKMTPEARLASFPGMVCLMGAALLALALGDIYVEPKNRTRFHTVRQVLLAYGAAYVAGSMLTRMVPSLGALRTVLIESAKSGFVLLSMGRITFETLVRPRAPLPTPVSLAEIRCEAERFHRNVRQRNIVEYGAAALGVAVSVISLVRATQPLQRAGLVLLILGMGYVALGLYRRASSRKVPSSLNGPETFRFYRAELAHQRDALQGVLGWYIAPLLPALLLMTAGQMSGGFGTWKIVPATLLWVFFAVLVTWLNRRAARKVQQRIDALEQLEKQS
jgi:hypothetical protein